MAPQHMTDATPSLIPGIEIPTDLRVVRRAAFPLGSALTLETLEGFESGIRAQRSLLEHEPVTWFDQVQAWLVTSRAAVEEVLTDHERFTVHAEPSFVRSVLGDHMLSHDEPMHRYHRAPYDPSLRLRAVRQNYTELVSRVADSTLNEFRDQGSVELRSGYASRVAVTVSGLALGLAFDDIDDIGSTYDSFAESMVDYTHSDRGTEALRARLDETIQKSIDRIREQPDSSVISAVLSQNGDEVGHTDQEIIGNIRILLFGAIETVTSIIVSTTWALLKHPDQLSAVLADPALIPSAVNETLRWISPVGHTERWATRDTELLGVPVKRGEMVLPSLAAANRDPAFFQDPDAFDIHRPNARHHSAFGKGHHHCIGLNLGNLEGQTAVERLLTSLPGLQLEPGSTAEPTGFGFRSPHELTVVWDA